MNILKRIRNRFNSRLPIGVTEFEAFVESIVQDYGLARSKELDRSYRWIVASCMTNLGPTAAYVPKYYFYLTIQTACAKEVAGDFMYKLKQEQFEEHKAAKAAAEETAKKLQEATINTVEASTSEQPIKTT